MWVVYSTFPAPYITFYIRVLYLEGLGNGVLEPIPAEPWSHLYWVQHGHSKQLMSDKPHQVKLFKLHWRQSILEHLRYMKTDLQSWCWRKLPRHSDNACWTTLCGIIPSTVTEIVKDVEHKAGCPWDSWTLLRKQQCHSLLTLKATMLLIEL